MLTIRSVLAASVVSYGRLVSIAAVLAHPGVFTFGFILILTVRGLAALPVVLGILELRKEVGA